MRVTNHYSTLRAIRALADSRSHLDDALERIASGSRLSAASDDPTAALGVMQDESQMRARTQYERNIGAATSRVTMEDSVLDRLSHLLTRAKELGISQASDTATIATRQSTAIEANQLLADAVQLAGTRFEDEFLFGGLQSTTRPYTVDTSAPTYTFAVAATPPAGARAVEIAAGQRLTATHDGVQVFGDATSGPLASLQALAAALASGDRTAVAAAIPALDDAMARTQGLVAETGARANQLQSVAATHRAMALDLDAAISAASAVDIKEAITELTARQTAFEAAMAAVARISGLSLSDYMR
ncbi:MAG: flagellin N-terminal helical domain-containing protein [Gemmatimonadaceae bacterium]